MGTRHLIGVVLDAQMKVAQYGQWDGYPSGVGVDILSYLRKADLSKLKSETRKLRYMNDEDELRCEARWVDLGAEPRPSMITMEQSAEFFKDFPFKALSRDMSADLLPAIEEGKVEFLSDESGFALDSLFCEWAYVVDLDREMLEVYAGFQKETPKFGRWAGQREDGSEYGAVNMVAEFPIKDLPTDAEFVGQITKKAEAVA